jgi:hypothetical protein
MACTETHTYPHHSTLASSLSFLTALLSTLQRQLEATHKAPSYRRVLYQFAYAAFAQYHFVDIHPFVDGNGRLCRFLSKFILDAVCPLPVPMFEDRDAYFNALRRAVDPTSAPLRLLQLLLSSAVQFYTSIVRKSKQNYGETVYVIFEEDDDPDVVLRSHSFIKPEHYDELRPLLLVEGTNRLVANVGDVSYDITKQELLVDLSTL